MKAEGFDLGAILYLLFAGVDHGVTFRRHRGGHLVRHVGDESLLPGHGQLRVGRHSGGRGAEVSRGGAGGGAQLGRSRRVVAPGLRRTLPGGRQRCRPLRELLPFTTHLACRHLLQTTNKSLTKKKKLHQHLTAGQAAYGMIQHLRRAPPQVGLDLELELMDSGIVCYCQRFPPFFLYAKRLLIILLLSNTCNYSITIYFEEWPATSQRFSPLLVSKPKPPLQRSAEGAGAPLHPGAALEVCRSRRGGWEMS